MKTKVEIVLAILLLSMLLMLFFASGKNNNGLSKAAPVIEIKKEIDDIRSDMYLIENEYAWQVADFEEVKQELEEKNE